MNLKNLIQNATALFFTTCSFAASAQSGTPTDAQLVKAFDTDALLPVLIDSAIKFSPDVKRTTSTIEIAEANLRMNKNAIYNSFSLSTGYGYGNNIAASNIPSGVGAVTNITTTQTGSYHVGAGLFLPLTQLINRKSMIRSGKLQVNVAQAEKENAEMEIRQEVIRLYQALKLSLRLVEVNGKSKQASQVNYTMAEKNFVQGQMNMEQFAVATNAYNKSTQDFEVAYNAFRTNYLLLEAFTGVNLSKLISQIR